MSPQTCESAQTSTFLLSNTRGPPTQNSDMENTLDRQTRDQSFFPKASMFFPMPRATLAVRGGVRMMSSVSKAKWDGPRPAVSNICCGIEQIHMHTPSLTWGRMCDWETGVGCWHFSVALSTKDGATSFRKQVSCIRLLSLFSSGR